MKAEEARKMTDEALAKLAEALEQGKSEALTRYLSVMARFHRYSFGNIMLILAQSPDATHVAGFNTWKSIGRWVKKGEKGITIIAPMILKKRDADESRDEQNKPIVRFKAVHVFDVSQTEGEPLPETASTAGDPGVYIDRLKLFIESRGITVTHDEVPHGALGVSKGGEIRVRSDLPPAQAFEVLAHELAHEMLHQGDEAVRGSKTVVETEAEAVAFVVCHAVGLQIGSAASDYIQLHQGSKDTLAQSLDRIQKTANTILEALAEQVGEEQLAA
jgi:antirestriction protein ArdC